MNLSWASLYTKWKLSPWSPPPPLVPLFEDFEKIHPIDIYVVKNAICSDLNQPQISLEKYVPPPLSLPPPAPLTWGS